ncbi:MAG: four helix bundle protein [Verrucomicrobiota bacterium]
MIQNPPPIVTLTEELLSWSLDRSADLPKSHRHSFGHRLDSLSISLLERTIIARFDPLSRTQQLQSLNLEIEILRSLWRILHSRTLIATRQLFFVTSKLDEIGRMANAWRLSSIAKSNP